ncbi:4Fe-4S dicluster domain-containing protein [Clostridium sp. DSM 8431]|uniref:4Fe-4S dicluster domain-containing protein n=1 Tax=Clostridium sp. DSM 8431 TaxID=1761781 RepID=UPI0008E642B8|nr:4Fe-4S binding protein [Clostridium sp. DSM 8431]SFU32003.1 4Fe-4S dicluster domain-containing protein [Clostridium sp. DSM 8431]
MSHMAGKEAYKSLTERINQFPQGAPLSETLYKILSILFTEKEARLVSQLPIRAFTAKTAARTWKLSEKEAEKILEGLTAKAVLFDIEHEKVKRYCLPPPMVGFFEFSLMRTRGDIDVKTLSELYHQYLNVEEDFIKDLFLGTETRFGRVLVQEPVLERQNQLEIMDYERATNVINTAKNITVSLCYCRHKMHHLGYDCYAPMETCLTFGNAAASLERRGYGRKIEKSEALEILSMCYEYNLVQCAENVRSGSLFLCNCCSCCCEGMQAVKKFGYLNPIETTSLLPSVVEDSCLGCRKCEKVCPIEAIKINLETKKAEVDEEICLGCGICARNCPKKAILLKKRDKEIITPANTSHRIVLQAIEKGQLQNLIFDNRALASHRALAAVLSAILKLSPVKKAMASKQMKSVYLDKLISKFD